MANITASDVMKLRQMTGVSMMECKKALLKTEGDYDAAVKLLRELGAAVSAKRAEKSAKEGLVFAKKAADGAKIAIVEVNCETDFVGNSADFKAFVDKVADAALDGEADLEGKLAEEKKALIAKVGEKVEIRRGDKLELQGTGVLASYIHLGGKSGVILEVGVGKPETLEAPEFQQLVKDLTLHVVASAPRWLERSQVPADVIEAEKEVNKKKLENEQAEKGGKPKPPEILEKIAMGQIGKFYGENCLLQQEFVKDNTLTVEKYIASAAKALGGSVEFAGAVRFEKGEGIEKRVDDLAAEVAKMVK